MSLDLAIEHGLGAFTLRLDLRSEADCLGITGASGSGKTTLLNLIAGTVRLRRGFIAASGRVLADTRRGVFLPPHRRAVGYVFQDGRLFPHLTVRQNLAYGRLFSGRRRGRIPEDHVIELLGIGPLLDRRAVGLSGGEQQRVAIGRALFSSPRLLLLDEPLASLDAARRRDVLPMIARVRDDLRVPLVYVSHAHDEIERLAGDVAILEGGLCVGRHAPPSGGAAR